MEAHSAAARLRQDPDLFGWTESPPITPQKYPHSPGFRGPEDGPSAQAATAIAPAVRGLQRGVLDTLKAAELTADQVAARLNRSVLSVRPRVAELRALGMIEPSPTRGKNESGMTANRWRPTAQGRAA